MKIGANGLGDCYKPVWFCAGTVKFNTTDVSTGAELCKIPHDCTITRAVAKVNTAFDAGTTNVLTIGTTTANANELLGSDDITEGTAGTYSKNHFVNAAANTPIVAKYTQTGTAATAGEAEIWLEAFGIPEIID